MAASPKVSYAFSISLSLKPMDLVNNISVKVVEILTVGDELRGLKLAGLD